MITQVKKRNFALDFLKFVFAVLIVLFHSNRFSNSVDERIIINGSKGVEFFFIVSGCMLAMSAEKREAGPSLGKDTWQFLKHKFMGLMPNYYIAWIFSFTLFHIVTGFETVWYDFIRSIPELLLFQMSGMSWYNYNGVTWYLSAMLISMLIIYPLIRKYTDTFFYILAPLGFLFSMGYLMQNYSNLSVILEWNTLVLAGLIRAFSEILLGCVVYKLSKSFQNYSTKINRALFTAAEWFIYGYTIFSYPCTRSQNTTLSFFSSWPLQFVLPFPELAMTISFLITEYLHGWENTVFPCIWDIHSGETKKLQVSFLDQAGLSGTSFSITLFFLLRQDCLSCTFPNL